MEKSTIRVRFAPSPSGFMHLGNVQIALINYLFARQKNGTFILRIEDTDPQRNIDPKGIQIQKDLTWLTLSYDEGPEKGGPYAPYAPYFQSQRSAFYTEALNTLKGKGLVYPCFCSSEELEKKRQRQRALKQPPHYDRTCFALTNQEIEQKFSTETPFIWRFKLDHSKTVSFYDLAHKTMHFELKHFSDVPLTRQDGSFTFLFANFVDDHTMNITHVFRGEDHLANTAAQVALYEALHKEVPVFWHLPILCTMSGKKLSKRDFGFSLADLQKDGYLPEAIINYLGIIGHVVKKEIMDLDELSDTFNFDHLSPTGQIKYDVEKLRWINHQWIMNYDIDKLVSLCRPFIQEKHPRLGELDHTQLKALIEPLQQELTTLKQSADLLDFVVTQPMYDPKLLEKYHLATYTAQLKKLLPQLLADSSENAVSLIKSFSLEHHIPAKDIFALIRIGLTGKAQGPGINDLFGMLGAEESARRLNTLIS